MRVPQYARYDYCNQKACDFLEEFNVTTFPVDVESIINRNRWALVKYSDLMKQFSCKRDYVIECLGSKDGFTIFDGNNYTIAYNDDITLGNRTRFTLMHEVGHIYLGHLIDFDSTKISRNSLTSKENRVLENEANAFARNVLVPTLILEQLKNKSIHNIAKVFGITESAARTRLDLYNTDFSFNENRNILFRLRMIFYKFYYKKLCLVCGYHTISESMKYCPICGSQSFKRGDGKMKYTDDICLDFNGKARICPKCKNEDIISDGEYCHICGTYLINKCDNRYVNNNTFLDFENQESPCGQILPYNARFCPHCGHYTTFFNDKILCAWDHYSQKEFRPIPDEIDDELPFN